MTQIIFYTISHSLMVHALVLEAYIHFALRYTADNILPALPIIEFINEDGDTAMPFKLATGNKHSISHLRVLFCPCVVLKATAHVGTKSLNMSHQSQKGFRGIFVGISQHQKGYLVYVPYEWKIVYSYDVVSDENLSSALAYMSQPYAEAMAIRLSVSYILCDTSLK